LTDLNQTFKFDLTAVKKFENALVYQGIDKTGQDFFQFAWINTTNSKANKATIFKDKLNNQN